MEWFKPGNLLWSAIIVNPHNVEESVAEIERYATKTRRQGDLLSDRRHQSAVGLAPLRQDTCRWRKYSGLPVLLHSVGTRSRRPSRTIWSSSRISSPVTSSRIRSR